MAWSPSFNGNIFSHTTNGAFTWRGPASSSASNVNHNIFMGGVFTLGTATNRHNQAYAGTNVNGNAIFNGNITSTAFTTPLSSSVLITGNLVFGASVTLNNISSSITYNSNVQNGGITINNSYLPIAGTNTVALNARVGTNTVYGFGHLVNISGSNVSTTQTKQFQYNILAGTYLSASVGDGDNSAIIATGLIGNGLVITGSTSPAAVTGTDLANNSQGSLFAGRFNALDGTRNRTGETIFAVGTGTSYTGRKTGFLIDSGSNTFVEGTLNVSGSTTITGSLSVTNLIVSGSTQFNVGAFNSTITQSGSSAVSQSMTFNNTDITQGVSVVDTTKLTIANSGTYNIQFSAQLLADTGADTIWIWLKKNGTNVSNTATKLVLANNEASVAAWNFVIPATASDYFELVWQNNGGHTKLLYETASGNYPAIPSVIATVTQVR